ncbi:GSCFA domain-containing protein [Rubellimicrobium sp. CFH 75288]|uniref:GSCFA domain-containing protein n=1 Tax=Rubellimicrobium sp. CFH 75288 TaxID=2697034 RepID=UPI001411DB45|nr:GSCFA domain-containing protein [Rubellimicrobium sp. CFH 75288]NAZ35579.1 GSCFA family protein [Rubellimicrobium sp. CFH 75288]
MAEQGAAGREDRPLERMGAAEAMLRARGNDLRRYPAPDRDGDRLYPLASPTVTPSFRIGPEDTIFAIGSCFARNVERALEAAGRRVLSRAFDLGEIGASLEDAANFFNKYSIHSVLNELRWALERDSWPGAEAIYTVGPDRHVDAQLGMARLDFPLETVLAFRSRYLDAMAQVAQADVIILTLGYVETWFDRRLGLYLNVMPPMQAIKAEPDRFEFRVLSYADVLRGLEDLHALLLRHRTRPLRMLVTVSPVPLLATFRDMDVLVANAYSKSVQRAAIDEFVRGREGVDYFPSYEFVTLSNPAVAWSRGDYRHVSADVVDRIMADVLARYVEGSEGRGGLSAEGLAASARMLAKLGHHEELVALCERHRDLADADPDVLLLEAASARRLDRLERSFAALARAEALAPERPDALERMILLCRPLRQRERARELLGRHAAAFPARSGFRDKVTWA